MSHNQGKTGKRRAGMLKEILDARASAQAWTKKRRVIRQRYTKETEDDREHERQD